MAPALQTLPTDTLQRRLVSALGRRDRTKDGTQENYEARTEISAIRDTIRARALLSRPQDG